MMILIVGTPSYSNCNLIVSTDDLYLATLASTMNIVIYMHAL